MASATPNPIRDFALNSSGDLAVVNGDFATVAGAAAVPQLIQTGLQMFLGECYLDQSVGLPWLQTILVKGADPLVVRELITEQILATQDVTTVVGTQLQTVDRTATINYEAATVYSNNPVGGLAQVQT